MATKTFRLNRKHSSSYALFIIDEDAGTAEYRRFEFYTGPMLEERRMTVADARTLYREMTTKLVKDIDPSVPAYIEWVPSAANPQGDTK